MAPVVSRKSRRVTDRLCLFRTDPIAELLFARLDDKADDAHRPLRSAGISSAPWVIDAPLPPFPSASARRSDELQRNASSSSVHEIALSHWQHFSGLAGEKPAVGPHFIGFRVNLHTGGGAVQNHGMLAELAGVRDWEELFCKSQRLGLFQ